MKKILVTGGPVHAYLDSVKIITNRFKGGLMASLADNLSRLTEVTYLSPAKLGSVLPKNQDKRINLIEHRGFEDYMGIVLEIAPQVDAVVLGAAVANLIPANPYKGKFPSHNYKPGDIIPIDFTIAPRIIDQVKKVAPKTHLFGFKLLDHVSHSELISAAYDIVLNSGATAVLANDAAILNEVYAVTKERGVHPLLRHQLADWIQEMINDEYYKTYFGKGPDVPEKIKSAINKLLREFSSKFITVENGMIFGTVAIRDKNTYGFFTTGRGKRELDDIVHVLHVDQENKEVTVTGSRKASLNAPLLDKMFENSNVEYIVHYHEQESGLPSYGYAPPGTVRDTNRPNETSFNIQEHGCVLLFDKNGRRL